MKRRFLKRPPPDKPFLKSIEIQKPPGSAGENFPFSIPAIRSLESLDFHRDVTFFVGENGSGKSTLIEALAALFDLSAQGGSSTLLHVKDAATPHKYKKNNAAQLENFMKAVKGVSKPRDKYFLRSESFYNVATFLEEMADNPDNCTSREQVFSRYGGKELHQLSHGEAFLALLKDGLFGNGLYLLDEPEAALSPSRQLAALIKIHELALKQSQFVIATHSPILMSYPNSIIYLLDDQGCRRVEFEETEHYKVTRDYLLNYERRLTQLLTEPLTKDNYSEDDDTELDN